MGNNVVKGEFLEETFKQIFGGLLCVIGMVVMGRKASKNGLTEKKLQVLGKISDGQSIMRERESTY